MGEINNYAREEHQAALLKEKILNHTARVAVIGLGYVGLQLSVEKAKAGFTVTGIDQDVSRVEQINSGLSYIKDVPPETLHKLVLNGALRAVREFDVLPDNDIIIICVPTPLSSMGQPDMSYIYSATNSIARHIRKGQMICLESTTYPGTTEEVILPALEAVGLKVGQDFFLAFSPERVDPGNRYFSTANITKVVGGVTGTCMELACTFYSQSIHQVVPVSSPTVAEMTKVFENTYRAVNIALVNEMMILCDRMGLDVWEVVDAASTKPFGIETFHPGPGVGGHCIPVDPYYLAWKAREFDFHTRFIELAGELNVQASYHVVDKLIRILNRRKKCLNGSRILVLGVAYKKDIDDIRESPALKVIELLRRDRALVVYHDPYVQKIQLAGREGVTLQSAPLTEKEVSMADCILIITDHSCIDYQWVTNHARLILDARNATKNITGKRNKIVKI